MTDPDVTPPRAMCEAAEMLWILVANVSGGDWTKQSAEWQAAAARYRDQYFAAKEAARTNPLQSELLDLITLMPESQTREIVVYIMALRDMRRMRDGDRLSSTDPAEPGDPPATRVE